MEFLICFAVCGLCMFVGYAMGRVEGHKVAANILCAAWAIWHENKSLAEINRNSDIERAYQQFKRDLQKNNFIERVL